MANQSRGWVRPPSTFCVAYDRTSTRSATIKPSPGTCAATRCTTTCCWGGPPTPRRRGGQRGGGIHQDHHKAAPEKQIPLTRAIRRRSEGRFRPRGYPGADGRSATFPPGAAGQPPPSGDDSPHADERPGGQRLAWAHEHALRTVLVASSLHRPGRRLLPGSGPGSRIAPMYPEQDLGAERRLRMFLEQYWEGRNLLAERGHPKLRMRHAVRKSPTTVTSGNTRDALDNRESSRPSRTRHVGLPGHGRAVDGQPANRGRRNARSPTPNRGHQCLSGCDGAPPDKQH